MDEKKPKNYIQRLKAENEELRKQVEEAKAIKVVEQVVEKPSDDREEIIDVWIERLGSDAQGRVIFQKHSMSKKAALEALVAHYSTKRNKQIPDPVPHEPQRNAATCYCRIVKRDKATGQKQIAVQDMPIWIAAERMMEGKAVELISKQEYEDYYAKKGLEEDKWKKEYNEKKRQQAIEALAATN